MHGTTVLITGAKGGLGAHVTQAFLDSGARVGGISRSIKQGDFPEGDFVALPAELTNSASAAALAQTARERFGEVDVLVHLMGDSRSKLNHVDAFNAPGKKRTTRL